MKIIFYAPLKRKDSERSTQLLQNALEEDYLVSFNEGLEQGLEEGLEWNGDSGSSFPSLSRSLATTLSFLIFLMIL